MTLLYKLRNRFALLTFVLLLLACGDNGENNDSKDEKDRKPILVNWVDNIIIPSYSNFKSKFDIMLSKSAAFQTSPSNASLIEFRAAWVEAYVEWQKVELFEFGPADKYTLRSLFNIYPTDVNGILANVADPSVNLDLPSEYAKQGFPALDYLLNGVGADDAAIVDFYTNTTDAGKRIAYIKRICDRMNSLITNVLNEWNGSYKDTFINKTGLDIGSSIGNSVNSYVLYYERYVRSGKIGIPSGSAIATNGVKHPEKVEAYYKKDISNTLAKAAHTASVDFFNGVNVATKVTGPSFKTYLDAIDAKDASSGVLLSEIINNQFKAISDKLNPLSPNLYQEVMNNNQAVIDVHTEMQKLVRMLKVDMTSAMSVTITYTDNDGD